MKEREGPAETEERKSQELSQNSQLPAMQGKTPNFKN